MRSRPSSRVRREGDAGLCPLQGREPELGGTPFENYRGIGYEVIVCDAPGIPVMTTRIVPTR